MSLSSLVAPCNRSLYTQANLAPFAYRDGSNPQPSQPSPHARSASISRPHKLCANARPQHRPVTPVMAVSERACAAAVKPTTVTLLAPPAQSAELISSGSRFGGLARARQRRDVSCRTPSMDARALVMGIQTLRTGNRVWLDGCRQGSCGVRCFGVEWQGGGYGIRRVYVEGARLGWFLVRRV